MVRIDIPVEDVREEIVRIRNILERIERCLASLEEKLEKLCEHKS